MRRSASSQEMTTLIQVRDFTSQVLIQIYNDIREIYETHGHALPPTEPDHFTQLVSATIHKLPTLTAFTVGELIAGYDPTRRSLRRLTQEIEKLVKQNTNN